MDATAAIADLIEPEPPEDALPRYALYIEQSQMAATNEAALLRRGLAAADTSALDDRLQRAVDIRATLQSWLNRDQLPKKLRAEAEQCFEQSFILIQRIQALKTEAAAAPIDGAFRVSSLYDPLANIPAFLTTLNQSFTSQALLTASLEDALAAATPPDHTFLLLMAEGNLKHSPSIISSSHALLARWLAQDPNPEECVLIDTAASILNDIHAVIARQRTVLDALKARSPRTTIH